MGITWRWGILALLFGSLAMQASQHVSGAPPSDKLASGPGWPELNSSMDKMHAAMSSMEPSGNTDVDFARLMLPHHQAAIDMAQTQLLHGTDPQMRRLAQEIIVDQQSEVELMQLWLKQHELKEK